MSLVYLLAQAAPETGTGSTNTIRIIAGAVALVFIVVIILRRKRKSSKEDWS